MFSMKSISNPRRSFVVIIILLIMAIAFETFQQLFYIRKYDLAQGITFFDVLKTQAYRWILWLCLGLFLFQFARRQSIRKSFGFGYFLKYGLFIIFLVAVNIVLIAILQVLLHDSGFDLGLFVNEYLVFFIFQKAPIYILGYSAIAIILHFYFLNEKLQFKVQELSEIKDENLKLYNQLKLKMNDKTSVLNIKIGNKRKIILVEEIVWIEADDYCVKVHLKDGKSYTMRSSLKTLEEKLQRPFIRVHRKAIVNMKMAAELSTSPSPLLLLKNKLEIPVSRSYLGKVRSYIS
ncbi:MAG: DNA-binding response regulator [Flavobacterium sp.]|nr:MAG: DNA-binding response regulator [Flavobacterium sp.]